jgi:peptide deformylase
MILNIEKFPEDVLRKKSIEVTNIDDSVIKLLNDMVDTMQMAPGVGLAAPQVGASIRLVVANLSPAKEKQLLYKFINPVVYDAEGEEMGEEGCLSIPGEYAFVKRAKKVLVKALNTSGEEFSLELEDLPARIVLHEIDHLDGILFIDRLPIAKKEIVKKHIRKRMLAGEY